jgi:hypothetical protein
MVGKDHAGLLLRLLFVLLMCIILFVPINYMMIALHEGAHAFATLALGGWCTKIVLTPDLFTGGGTYCGGAMYEEIAIGAGMIVTSLVGTLCAARGGWLGRYIGLICGVRLFVGYANLLMHGGYSDTSMLLQMGTPLAALMLALATALGLAAIFLAIWNDGDPTDL